MGNDLIIRNARLRSGALVDIAVSDGRYVEIAPNVAGEWDRELDAGGCLVTESYVVAQQHLDKVFTGAWIGETTNVEYTRPQMGGAMTAIEYASQVKRRYEHAETVDRVERALMDAQFAGVTHMRAFCDVDTAAGLTGVQAVIDVRDRWRDRIDLQVVAFAQDGILRDEGAEQLLHEAMRLGADLVGGIPWIEYTDADMRRHIEIVFDIAASFDVDVTMLVDDAGDPDLRTTEWMAVAAIERGWEGRVAACHGRAMALYNEVYHRKVVHLLKQARMGIVSNPHTAPLAVQVKDLVREGVAVALGGESVWDAYYPFGRCNMLEAAFVASHTLWLQQPDDWELLYDAISVNPADIMRVPRHRLEVGCDANCVVLPVASMRDALTYHPDPRYVIRAGRVSCETRVERSSSAAAPS